MKKGDIIHIIDNRTNITGLYEINKEISENELLELTKQIFRENNSNSKILFDMITNPLVYFQITIK